MLEWIILGYGIYRLLRQDIETQVKKEEEILAQEIEEFKTKYDDSKRELEKRIEDAKHNVNFENCTNAHHQSVLTSNIAYSILDREQRLKSIYYAGVKKIDSKIKVTQDERDKLKFKSSEREEKHKEFESGIQLKNGILAHLKNHGERSSKILTDVKTLNNKTRELKLLIKDNFGKKGLDWYNRLEERTANRRKN